MIRNNYIVVRNSAAVNRRARPHPAEESHLSCCDLPEIEIAIEIEKVGDLDFIPDFDLDFDFDKTNYMRSP